MADLRNRVMQILSSRIKSYEKAGVQTTFKCFTAKVLYIKFERLSKADTRKIASIILEEKEFLESLYTPSSRFVKMRQAMMELIDYSQLLCTTN